MATLPLLLLLPLVLLTTVNAQENGQLVPALYIFGDSTVDGGNMELQKVPYGIDLNAMVPVRWSNGMTIADFMATFLGLPLVPPYNNASEAGKSTTGVNYGYAGSGMLPETGPKGWTFDDQITKFNMTLASNLSTACDLQQHLKESIFLISFGINDYQVNYFPPANRTLSRLSPVAFARLLVNQLSTGLTALYELGARKFLVRNIWPLGCTPLYAKQSDPLVNSCNETINALVLPYSNILPQMLKELESNLPGTAFSHSNDFAFVIDLKLYPAKYGITNTTGRCLLNDFGGTPCSERDRFLYFDIVHTTQAANKAFSLSCYNGTLCTPRNIVHLVGVKIY